MFQLIGGLKRLLPSRRRTQSNEYMKNTFPILTSLLLSVLAVRGPGEKLWAQETPLSPKGEIAPSVVFIGNSFTYGDGSPVRFYRAGIVTDLNGEGIGGVPALFKMFVLQAGRDFRVSLETESGANLDFHLQKRAAVLGQRWDFAVMQGQSLLDPKKPGDPKLLVHSARELAELLRSKNPKVDIRLVATWACADQIYPESRLKSGHWRGKPIERMALDIRAGYDLAAAAGAPAIRGVIAVGEAWNRAFKAGVADPNPYDGISAGQVDLWTYDHKHASAFGYYLEALMIFGDLTGLDPRSLGKKERAAFELGFSPEQAIALQQVAFDELDATKERPQLQTFQPVVPASLKRGK